MSTSIPLSGTDKKIGGDAPCFVIAEIGANHDGDPDKAYDMIDMAARAGAAAVKFQTYTADDLTVAQDRLVTWGPPGGTVTESIGGMFDRVKLPRAAHADLFKAAQAKGLVGFSTPFSEDGVAFLEGLDVPLYKIASSDVTYVGLLKAVAQTKKPVILSTGKSTLAETIRAVDTLCEAGSGPVIILHCVAMYPAPMDQMSLSTIPVFKDLWPDRAIGLSDHSHGITACLGAVALGAKVIEKHVTYAKDAIGPDHWFSADEAELTSLVSGIWDMEKALGQPRTGILAAERDERKFSIRSLVTAVDIPAGTRIEDHHLKATRPGWGIDPFEISGVVGRVLAKPVPKDCVLTWELLADVT